MAFVEVLLPVRAHPPAPSRSMKPQGHRSGSEGRPVRSWQGALRPRRLPDVGGRPKVHFTRSRRVFPGYGHAAKGLGRIPSEWDATSLRWPADGGETRGSSVVGGGEWDASSGFSPCPTEERG